MPADVAELVREASYLLYDQVGEVKHTDACLAAERVEAGEGSGFPWFELFFALRTLLLIIELVGLIDQLCLLGNKQKCEGIYAKLD